VSGGFLGIETKNDVLEVLAKRSSVNELERCLTVACGLGDFELRSTVTERLLDAVLDLPFGSTHRVPKLRFATKQIVQAILAQADDLVDVVERARQAGRLLSAKTTRTSPEDFIDLSNASRTNLNEFVTLLSHPTAKSRLEAGLMLRKDFDRPDLAIRVYDLVLENAPNFVQARTMKGAAQSDVGDLHGAVATLEGARALKPKSKYVNNALSRAYENVGRFAEAFDVVEVVLQKKPDDSGALLRKIVLLIKTNKHSQLAELFDRLDHLLPAKPYRDIWVSLVAIEALFQMGQTDQARAALLKLPAPQGRENKSLHRKMMQRASQSDTWPT